MALLKSTVAASKVHVLSQCSRQPVSPADLKQRTNSPDLHFVLLKQLFATYEASENIFLQLPFTFMDFHL